MSTARHIAAFALLACIGLPALTGCVYQPLYGTNSYAPELNGYALSQISVDPVDTRVGQQVRNHLIFLLQGGNPAPEPAYSLRLRVADTTQLYAANRTYGGTTAGTASVKVSYVLFDMATRKPVSSGSRIGSAAFDRTGQSFANERAELDAQNRAAQDAAEKIRLALAGDLTKR